MTTVPMPGRFDIGRVISRLFGVLGRNFVVFGLLSLFLVGAPTLLVGLSGLLRTATTTPTFAEVFTPLNIGLGVGAILVSVVANSVLQGAIIHGTVGDLAGVPASFGDCLATGARFILPLIGIGLVSGVCVGLASILLIVPGVLLALAWCVAAPAAVVERTGVFGAFGRSVTLTRDCRGAIFGLAVIYFIILMVVQSVVAVIMTSLQGLSFTSVSAQNSHSLIIVQAISTFLIQTITALVSSAGIASVYYELRSIKDGVGAEQLAAVFD